MLNDISIGGFLIYLVILLFSAILHEIAHGVVAEYFGDPTARLMGRITLNPIVHIDLYFSILVPLLLYFAGSPVLFGAAKPVPVNYNNLRNYRWGVFCVALAGIVTNIFLAVVFLISVHIGTLPQTARDIFIEIAEINILLAMVNLIPIPPIDGSKALAALFGERAIDWVSSFERRGIWGLLPFIILIYILFLTPIFQDYIFATLNFFLRVFHVS